MGNVNIQKVMKQIIINISIMVSSVIVIYIGLFFQPGLKNISWKDGLNAELIFVMISSLGSVVGWRIVEGIRTAFTCNLLLIVVGGLSCLVYGVALVNNNENVKMVILGFVLVLFGLYIIEQIRLLKFAAQKEPQKKSNHLKYKR